MVSGTHASFLVNPPVPFRATPTLTATGSDWQAFNTVAADATAIALASTSTNQVAEIDLTVTLNTGTAVFMQGDSSADRYLKLIAQL